MNWKQISKKLKKIKYTFGVRNSEREIWNCPCINHDHPVSVGVHPTNEAYPFDLKKQLGPHRKEFGI